MRLERALYSCAKWSLAARARAICHPGSRSLAMLPEPVGNRTASSMPCSSMIWCHSSICCSGLALREYQREPSVSNRSLSQGWSLGNSGVLRRFQGSGRYLRMSLCRSSRWPSASITGGRSAILSSFCRWLARATRGRRHAQVLQRLVQGPEVGHTRGRDILDHVELFLLGLDGEAQALLAERPVVAKPLQGRVVRVRGLLPRGAEIWHQQRDGALAVGLHVRERAN